jgi:flavorubredoxin
MHGPAVSSALTQLLREYRNWISEQIKAADAAVVCVLYARYVLEVTSGSQSPFLH